MEKDFTAPRLDHTLCVIPGSLKLYFEDREAFEFYLRKQFREYGVSPDYPTGNLIIKVSSNDPAFDSWEPQSCLRYRFRNARYEVLLRPPLGHSLSLEADNPVRQKPLKMGKSSNPLLLLI